MSAETRDAFEPLDLDAAFTPHDIDRFLRGLYNELYIAERALRESRYKEIQALRAYSEAKQPLLMDPDCPDTSRSGVTKTAQEDWISGKIPDLYWAYQGAKVVRMNSQDYAKRLDSQVKVLQSINSVVKQMYGMSGSHG